MAKTRPISKTMYDVKRINDTLDRYHGYSVEVHNVIDRLMWLKKWGKIPVAVSNAFIAKATAIFDGTWHGDEPEERVISNYIHANA